MSDELMVPRREENADEVKDRDYFLQQIQNINERERDIVAETLRGLQEDRRASANALQTIDREYTPENELPPTVGFPTDGTGLGEQLRARDIDATEHRLRRNASSYQGDPVEEYGFTAHKIVSEPNKEDTEEPEGRLADALKGFGMAIADMARNSMDALNDRSGVRTGVPDQTGLYPTFEERFDRPPQTRQEQLIAEGMMLEAFKTDQAIREYDENVKTDVENAEEKAYNTRVGEQNALAHGYGVPNYRQAVNTANEDSTNLLIRNLRNNPYLETVSTDSATRLSPADMNTGEDQPKVIEVHDAVWKNHLQSAFEDSLGIQEEQLQTFNDEGTTQRIKTTVSDTVIPKLRQLIDNGEFIIGTERRELTPEERETLHTRVDELQQSNQLATLAKTILTSSADFNDLFSTAISQAAEDYDLPGIIRYSNEQLPRMRGSLENYIQPMPDILSQIPQDESFFEAQIESFQERNTRPPDWGNTKWEDYATWEVLSNNLEKLVGEDFVVLTDDDGKEYTANEIINLIETDNTDRPQIQQIRSAEEILAEYIFNGDLDKYDPMSFPLPREVETNEVFQRGDSANLNEDGLLQEVGNAIFGFFQGVVEDITEKRELINENPRLQGETAEEYAKRIDEMRQ